MDVTNAIQTALRSRYPDITIVPGMSAGGTDGKHFRIGGVPTYGAGGAFIQLGDKVNAHGLNEKLRVSSFYEGLDHWIILIKTIAGPAE